MGPAATAHPVTNGLSDKEQRLHERIAKNRMKIVHIAAGFSIAFAGGVPNYVRNLATVQVERGHDVYVVDGGEHADWTRLPAGFSVRSTEATSRVDLPAGLRARRAEAVRLTNVIRGLAPDLVHVHQTISMPTHFFALFPGSGLRYVVSLHDYYLFCPRITMVDVDGEISTGPELKKCERCVGLFDRSAIAAHVAKRAQLPLPRIASHAVTSRNRLIAAFLARAETVLAVSNRVQELFSKVYPEADYRTLHIGTASATSPRPAKVAASELRLTMMGTLEKYKGAGVLEEIAKRVTRTDVRLRFWGRAGDPVWRERLSAVGVELSGAYAPEDLPSILSETDVGLVLPIWEDNAPQVLMEFLNFGVPVIATSMGGVPDFVNDRNGYLFDPRTSEGIADAARYIDGLDPQLVRKSGAELPRLTTLHDHEKEIAAVYEECVARPRGRRDLVSVARLYEAQVTWPGSP